MAERSKDHSRMPLMAPSDDEPDDTDTLPALPPAQSIEAFVSAPRVLVFDFVALVMIITVLATGIGYVTRYPIDFQPALRSLLQPETPAASVPVSVIPPQADAPHRAPLIESNSKGIAYIYRVDANVRAEPSATSPVIAHERVGKRLNVFERQGAWVRIGEQAPVGWVHQSLLQPTPP